MNKSTYHFASQFMAVILCLLFFAPTTKGKAENLALTAMSASSDSNTPFSIFRNQWETLGFKSDNLNLLTVVPSKTVEQMSPRLKKALKVKNDVKYDTLTNVGGVLTTLLKEKYGKKSNAKNDFLAIQYSTKSQDFADYLRKYPNSKYAEEARARQACFEENELWTIAEAEDDRESYEAFTKKCASQPLCDLEGCENISIVNHNRCDAINEWYELTDLSKENDPSIYKDYAAYLKKHGEKSIFAERAADSLELNKDRYDWKLATAENTSEAYKEYIENHQDGKYKWKAENIAKELGLWEKAVSSGKYNDYCTYYTEYPDGMYAEKAIENIKQHEAAAWNEAKKKNTLKAYEDFVGQYPSGFYSNEAQNKITELRLAPYLKKAPSFSSIQEVGYYSHPGYSLICLGNVDKSKTITVSLTGATGFSKRIGPGKCEWVRVKNGSYKILVQASDVENWWGKATFENKMYAEAWSTYTQTSFNGSILPFTEISNKDEKAVKRIVSEIKAKAEEEEIKTINYILNGN